MTDRSIGLRGWKKASMAWLLVLCKTTFVLSYSLLLLSNDFFMLLCYQTCFEKEKIIIILDSRVFKKEESFGSKCVWHTTKDGRKQKKVRAFPHHCNKTCAKITKVCILVSDYGTFLWLVCVFVIFFFWVFSCCQQKKHRKWLGLLLVSRKKLHLHQSVIHMMCVLLN